MFNLNIARLVLGIEAFGLWTGCALSKQIPFIYHLTLFVAYLTIICDVFVEANEMK